LILQIIYFSLDRSTIGCPAFHEISQALSESLDLIKSLYKVLEILSNSMGMVRGTVTILNPLRNESSIEVAHGPN